MTESTPRNRRMMLIAKDPVTRAAVRDVILAMYLSGSNHRHCASRGLERGSGQNLGDDQF